MPRKDGKRTLMRLKYEKLYVFCSSCGRLGHDKKNCKEEEAKAIFNPLKPRYGPGIGVPLVKPIDIIIKKIRIEANLRMKTRNTAEEFWPAEEPQQQTTNDEEEQ